MKRIFQVFSTFLVCSKLQLPKFQFLKLLSQSNQQILIQVAPPLVVQQTLVQARVHQVNVPMVWRPINASSMTFTAYHDLPKNQKYFCSKFHNGDLSHIANEHIKIFEDFQNQDIQEDVVCILFP